MVKLRSRAIIPYNEGILMIHRIREIGGKRVEYYVFPGGGVEGEETPEECIVREAFEELSINVKVDKELYRLSYVDEGQLEILYLCDYISGEIKIGNGPEFQEKNRGLYIPTVVKIEDIHNLNIIEEVKKALIADLKKYKNIKSIPKRERNLEKL
ncbi:nucleoside triphosphate pyrophosphohydrolase [Clostridium tepidiprofundi DSM 19306]|uniref:Nucleoside triphosphate pyrophosphohydrolase n=1 Tax=Clostridium tepidiprofundi DSM 19306 TaxID=1121338 RepID=A0A151AWL0_9CLOT|nr:NUDIX domain-containing protein [Clostridium tepidiprofundi]KYH32059.1 nucleoside triphosphate pyrophosphohydrolase [Clostridium tepidiprofundi DSM 19306]